MKTKIKSVMVIGTNFFKNYEVGQTVNGLVIDQIERFGSDEDGESFAGFSVKDGKKAIIFDLVRVPIVVNYEEEKQPAKHPCPKCGEEWDYEKTSTCTHCGNVVPF